MQYALLIYSEESKEPQPGTKEFETYLSDYYAFTNEVKAKGVYVAGEALNPVATATTVRVKDDKPLTTDGPFAETKEQLGGFYILDCKDLDEAVHYAARIPTARRGYGSIEVRPIMKFE